MPVTWSDEKLIILYWDRTHDLPHAVVSQHDQGVPRSNHSATAAVKLVQLHTDQSGLICFPHMHPVYRNYLPTFVLKAIKPVIEALSDDSIKKIMRVTTF